MPAWDAVERARTFAVRISTAASESLRDCEAFRQFVVGRIVRAPAFVRHHDHTRNPVVCSGCIAVDLQHRGDFVLDLAFGSRNECQSWWSAACCSFWCRYSLPSLV